MWITEATENESYMARAESHGCVYVSTLSIAPQADGCTLTMTFESQPRGFVAKLVSAPMGLLFKGVMRKALLKDLIDIKAAVERA